MPQNVKRIAIIPAAIGVIADGILIYILSRPNESDKGAEGFSTADQEMKALPEALSKGSDKFEIHDGVFGTVTWDYQRIE